MNKSKVAIIDYGINNISSISKALNSLEIKNEIIENYKELKNFNHLILPGIGSFDFGINKLKEKGFKDEIILSAKKGSFILGICLGMQLLFEKSEESESNLSGLSLAMGECKKLKSNISSKVRVPHMGWNSIKITKQSKLLKNIPNNSEFYFAHSYYIDKKNPASVAVCEHGVEFTGVFEFENIMGTQFHPEKSFSRGLGILKQFSSLS
jgi:glutamine amidotransferase